MTAKTATKATATAQETEQETLFPTEACTYAETGLNCPEESEDRTKLSPGMTFHLCRFVRRPTEKYPARAFYSGVTLEDEEFNGYSTSGVLARQGAEMLANFGNAANGVFDRRVLVSVDMKKNPKTGNDFLTFI